MEKLLPIRIGIRGGLEYRRLISKPRNKNKIDIRYTIYIGTFVGCCRLSSAAPFPFRKSQLQILCVFDDSRCYLGSALVFPSKNSKTGNFLFF